ncbi:DUF6165 family protein [Sphingomonas aracearum]|uniref:Uncharacterized protein n=1 Tax=Sphingomonas aracearum TaxID=2283317 RepID=A0A369VY47_9SPHN|nr:DUF6165 family protein [Sphingomonas aracearum]RDE06759.1 hypothetical protein DVW87_03430 [Sphingomonas aracearum]
MTRFATPSVPVSWGELIDKLTILEIKAARITRADALDNVARERRALEAIAATVLRLEPVAALHGTLRTVNEALWEIEDDIREHEAAGDFGAAFVRLARAVYRTNDERAALKRQINDLLGSELTEEKSYADWQAAAPRGAAGAVLNAPAR